MSLVQDLYLQDNPCTHTLGLFSESPFQKISFFSTNFGLYAPSDYFGTCSDKVRYTKITSLEQMNTCHISHAYFKVDLVNHTLIWTYHSSVINCYQLHRQAYLHYDIIVRNSHFWTPCIFSSSFPMQQIHWYYD